MQTCPACGQQNRLEARFCDSCGSALAAEPSSREVRKTVTLVFSDVSGSTNLAEKVDPESLRRVMSRYFEEMKSVLERHGGTVEKFVGDAVMAVFGIPAVHEDDALRAVRAAQEMRERLVSLNEDFERSWGVTIASRIGVNTGEVVAGDPARGESFATGDAVNVAARLEQAAQPGEILVGADTYRLVKEAVEVEAREPLALKGKEDAVAAFSLLDVLPEAAGLSRRLASPMVGRAREFKLLQDAFERVSDDRTCHLFTVLGAAGVGKSRVVEEFQQVVGSRATVLRGRCLPYGEGITFWPLAEAVKQVAGLDDSEPLERARARIAALLEGEEQAELIGARVAGVVGLVEATGSGTEETFWAVRKLLESLANRRPLVVVFDDIHWAETTFLDLVEHVADWSRDAPILLVCMARPELLDQRPGWGGGKLNASSILLEPLSETESEHLIENLLGQADLAAEARARISQAAEGNPLFVEEMLEMLIDDGLLARDNGSWIPTADLATVSVPPTIQALLSARLDRLEGEERGVLECASVEGKVFHRGGVVELAPETQRPRVGDNLMALVRKELIRACRANFSDEDAFRFRHLLIRDAAYDSLPKEVRAAFHERHAAWLEGKAGDRAVEYEEILGYHLEQAVRNRADLGPVDVETQELARKAAERLGAAGRRAFVRSDVPAGVNLIARAAALLPADDPVRVDLIPNVRIMQGWTGDLGWADTVLREAVAAGDERLRAHALVQGGLLRLFTGPDVTAGELLEVAEPAIEVFEELGDDLGLARAWRLAEQANYLARRAGPSTDAAERALVHARRAGDRFEEREIAQFLLVAMILGPAPAPEAARRCEQLRQDAAGDPFLEVNALGALAYFVAIQGRTEEARELLARGRADMGELSEWLWVVPPVYFGLYAAWEDDPVGAERELRPAYEALRRIGEKSHFSSLATALAQAVYAQGRYEDAEVLAGEAREASRLIDVQCQTISRTVKAKVLARRGEHSAAEELAREAIEFVEESDFLPVHGEALVDVAEVFQLVGQADEAAPALEAAVRLHDQKGNAAAAARARALHDGLV
jgi:class 3 adenylate cyclase/tetratricopeptide (TPR) repeat protein